MEFDWSWALWALPVAFMLGWFASRIDLRQARWESAQAPRAYFAGLRHLLNEEHDQAIDAFIEAVQQDPDTSELHFALGNLFRRRGEFDRAVRVHEHLLSRADLSDGDRCQAQYALALDYIHAGLLDHAEAALLPLQGTAMAAQAQLALLSNYERARDWGRAMDVAQQLHGTGDGDFSGRMAHYACEQAQQALALDDTKTAQEHWVHAIRLCSHNARPRLALAQWLASTGKEEAAWQTLCDALTACQASESLIALPLAQAAIRCDNVEASLDLLRSTYQSRPSIDILEALVQLGTHAQDGTAQRWYLRHLEQEPSLIAASRWLERQDFAPPEPRALVLRALDHAARPLLRYRCAACGFELTQHFWQCPGCLGWETFPPRRVEEL
ncbi:hypothetical protein [Candidatus Symbiobacter mobilis]|uniref:N-acetylglucosaminyl transferase-like protein n=1 Tax=Candidatus Symbiobacter mobilis CR TaxID=946483 RepID=U5N678_9BURK|nr:hypothetical protein [Candidatus Symbiobacter mobilis]AGX87021.1 N-acetylglucosaminyl transferase-like protein [Candidatus Symbiobacter mobilis CR]